MADTAQPGVLVRVPFAGADVEGWVLERAAASEHPGRLARLRRVVSDLPVLDRRVLELCRRVADHYAGTLADVVRLAVPGRHAAAEAAVLASAPEPTAAVPAPAPGDDLAGWDLHRAGPAFLRHLADGGAPRAVATLAPGTDPADALAVAARACLASGRSAVLVVPDHRDLDRLDAALTRRLPAGAHVRLEADAGPPARWDAYVRALTGRARVVAGTRAAVFAPVQHLGLVAVLDDGDDSHADQRTPYPHAREVARLRADLEGAAALLAGTARTAEAQQLLHDGWARPVVADRDVVRERAPRVSVAGTAPHAQDPVAAAARLPSDGWRVLREAVRRGPVLVQVPRGGYVPTLACATCREPARCSVCAGPLALDEAAGTPSCRWCGRPAADHVCPHCGDTRFRAVVTGARRTAEEMGRAFPGVDVVTSGGSRVVDRVGDRPALVIATPGAEPVAGGGYAAAMLLDGWVLLGRPDLRAQEEALRRWTAAASLVRGAGQGGAVVVVADPQAPAVQALVRWDPAGFAERELASRAELQLPPAARFAGLIGAAADVAEAVAALPPLPDARVLGPVPLPAPPRGRDPEPLVRTVVRVPRERSDELAAALRALAAGRSLRKLPPVRVRVDPLQIG
ncbi:primosomal protein N' family DNA-binding protein [Kineococcus sp. SYSU DK004]|uniref:primosomal protein N' family DNA-binding protein n=1 Tax=Kineococcus sp. SYSU DK004 TaxID=3383125 RepID=UPI003D7DC7A6